jgi:nicotinate phosphoribosyltransferase
MPPTTLPLELGDLAAAAAAFEEGYASRLASFEYSICVQPTSAHYLVFAGLASVVDDLQQFQFDPGLLEYLRYHPAFAGISLKWFEHLNLLRFTGEIWSLAEGSIFFAPSPVLRITAPLEQGLILGGLITNHLTQQIRVATKVSRLLAACEGRQLIEMSVRQASNIEEACAITRAAYLAGITSTTNTEAARRWQLPTITLMSHAWPMLLPDEVEAFHRFGARFMTNCIPVVDTVDTLTGIMHAIASGAPMSAIRLDSGDLLALSQQSRKLLDENGRRHVKLFASGQLDEEKITKLVTQRAPIDGFAVGSSLSIANSLALNAVYKLVAVAERPGSWEPVVKLTLGKRSYPWPKQVYRTASDDGSYAQDVIAWDREALVGEKQLTCVMKQGQLTSKLPTVEMSRDFSLMQRIRLPADLLSIGPVKQKYPIRHSAALEQEMAKLTRQRSQHLQPAFRR